MLFFYNITLPSLPSPYTLSAFYPPETDWGIFAVLTELHPQMATTTACRLPHWEDTKPVLLSPAEQQPLQPSGHSRRTSILALRLI